MEKYLFLKFLIQNNGCCKAIAPNHEIKMIGIRPGEKLHEEMITESDSFRTSEFGNYYVILPSTKLWDEEKYRVKDKSDIGSFSNEPFSYNSENNSDFLTVGKSELIRNHVK